MKYSYIVLMLILSTAVQAQKIEPLGPKPGLQPQGPSLQKQPFIKKSTSSQTSNNRVLEGPINTQPYQRFGGNRAIFQELQTAAQQLEESITLYNQANQVFNTKTRQCFPPGNTLNLDQQRQASCRQTDSIEQCYVKYMELCTRREKASLDAAGDVMYQDGRRVKEMLLRNTRFR